MNDLSGTSSAALPFPLDCPLCPELPHSLDPFSLGVGILIGLSLGPFLDLLNIARQSWRCGCETAWLLWL